MPATGDLQGTPQTAGTFNFTVQATDRSGATATQSFSLVINPPTLTITVASPLPAGTVGVAYSQKLPVVASGGTPPYTWSVIAGSVPGLSFDPASLTLSGTPTTAGTFNFTIQATDSANLTATRSLSLTVNAASLSITTSRQLPDGRLNQPYTQIDRRFRRPAALSVVQPAACRPDSPSIPPPGRSPVRPPPPATSALPSRSATAHWRTSPTGSRSR